MTLNSISLLINKQSIFIVSVTKSHSNQHFSNAAMCLICAKSSGESEDESHVPAFKELMNHQGN